MKLNRFFLIFLIIVFICSFSLNCIAIDFVDPMQNEQQNQENENNNKQPEPEPEPDEEPEEYEEPEQTYTPPENNNNVAQPRSNNANLISLVLDVEGLSPEFNKDVIEYYLVVGLETEEIKVDAIAEDAKATVAISGNKNLEEGENKLQIVVKAEDGTTKVYTIMVIRSNEAEEMNANLESLEVTGYSFYPDFKRNIYNYNLTINEEITKLEINAKTEIEGATFEIEGNENLQEGENLIKIIVTAKDGTTKREYKINTFISTKKAELFQINKNQAYILIGVLGVAILVTGILVVKNKNN